jgi:UDP-N-acetylglucosamine acyltransferase
MSNIHETAVVHAEAKVGEGCRIGPYCIVGSQVVLGKNCFLHSHVVIDGRTNLGDDNEVFPFCSIGLKTQDLKWDGGRTFTEIGERNTFREYVTIHSATSEGGVTRVGHRNHVLAYSHIAHDVQVGNDVIMSNSATLGGHVVVQDRAVIGGLAAVHQFCRIGHLSIIGGCSKVVQDVAPFTLVDGNPAVTRTLNKVGMERRGLTEDSKGILKKAFRILFRQDLTLSSAVEKAGNEFSDCSELSELLEFIRSSQRGICR